MTITTIKTPAPALLYLLAGFAAILVIVLLLIRPAMNDTDRLRGEIAGTRAQIKEKKLLNPVYARLAAIKREQDDFVILPVPAPAPVDGDISLITADMERIARGSGMQLVSVTPSPASLEGDSKILVVNLVVEGRYAAFRDLLLGLLEIPYLHAVPNFQIREIASGREFTLRLMVLLRQ